MNHPHDLFFKEAFSRKSVVRSFIEHYLADNDRAIIDPDTLDAVKDSHITTDLFEFFSDALYSASTSDGSGRIYILFEHKSYLDHGIGSQLIENIAVILQHHRRQYGRNTKSPIIIAVVINQRSSGWEMGKEQLLYLRPFLSQPVFPDLRFTIIDLFRIPDEEIVGISYLKILFLTLKNIHSPDLLKKLTGITVIFKELNGMPEAEGYFKAFLFYLKAAVSPELIPEIRQVVREVLMEQRDEMNDWLREILGDVFKEDAKNIAREYEQKGMEKGMKMGIEKGVEMGIEKGVEIGMEIGMEKGMEKGVEKGMEKGMEVVALNMISLNMETPTICRATGLSSETVENLRRK